MTDAYPPLIAELLAIPHPTALGPGSPNRAAGDRLRGLDPAALFPSTPIRDPEMARACLAGLWLRFDFVDESHKISHEIESPTGSFWHAIMHRREPDAGNSKYWYRTIGRHPVVSALERQAPALGYGYSNPAAFVDFCERVRDTGRPDEEVAKQVQALEWRLLFEHCLSAAVS
jgi:hypothetical protein